MGRDRAFDRVAIEQASIEREGFPWRDVRRLFPFDDQAWSEGEYQRLLQVSLKSLETDDEREALLAMLDLQYAVLLEQGALQDRFLSAADSSAEPAMFGERVMAYLQINSNLRHEFRLPRRCARVALMATPAGTLIDRLLPHDE